MVNCIFTTISAGPQPPRAFLVFFTTLSASIFPLPIIFFFGTIYSMLVMQVSTQQQKEKDYPLAGNPCLMPHVKGEKAVSVFCFKDCAKYDPAKGWDLSKIREMLKKHPGIDLALTPEYTLGLTSPDDEFRIKSNHARLIPNADGSYALSPVSIPSLSCSHLISAVKSICAMAKESGTNVALGTLPVVFSVPLPGGGKADVIFNTMLLVDRNGKIVDCHLKKGDVWDTSVFMEKKQKSETNRAAAENFAYDHSHAFSIENKLGEKLTVIPFICFDIWDDVNSPRKGEKKPLGYRSHSRKHFGANADIVLYSGVEATDGTVYWTTRNAQQTGRYDVKDFPLPIKYIEGWMGELRKLKYTSPNRGVFLFSDPNEAGAYYMSPKFNSPMYPADKIIYNRDYGLYGEFRIPPVRQMAPPDRKDAFMKNKE